MTERLSDVVREMFTPHGPLARATAFFQPRQGQTDMALAVADTLEKGGSLVVEAGTGVGKTFAYLVPALLKLATAAKDIADSLTPAAVNGDTSRNSVDGSFPLSNDYYMILFTM